MFQIEDKYLLDIYVSNGVDGIITGLLNKKFDKLEKAKEVFLEMSNYLKNNNIMTILTNGKNNFEN